MLLVLPKYNVTNIYHISIKRHQSQQFKQQLTKVNTVHSDTMVLQCDFTEKFVFTTQNVPQEEQNNYVYYCAMATKSNCSK
jgi:hypothetical protein